MDFNEKPPANGNGIWAVVVAAAAAALCAIIDLLLQGGDTSNDGD